MSANISNTVLIQKPDLSTHDMTEQVKTTTSLGRLTPVYFQEVVPGDLVDINAEFITKFQPILTPAFQNFNAYMHYFYVPNRILWRNWKYFISNTKAPGAVSTPIHPYIDLSGEPDAKFAAPSVDYIFNYFGLQGPANLERVNPMYFAAYQLIYNEYFRHEQIHQDNRESLYLSDGDNSAKLPLLQAMRYRTYKDDYFTAALQAPQSGEEAALSLATENMVPVYRNSVTTGGGQKWVGTGFGGSSSGDVEVIDKATTDPDITGYDLYIDPNDATFQVTMNEMIQLNRMQEFLVRKNLAGNRYNEYILAMFGIQVPDLRIDRPDYICGIKTPISVSEVLNTATDQGQQTGQANAYAEGGRGNYKVLEHGVIIGIYSVMPTMTYGNAISKNLLVQNFEDYYAPIFDQMGEEPILNREIVQDHTDPDGTFGYVPKFTRYRMTFDKTTGEMNTNLTTWHMARYLPDNVTLNDQFFDCKNPWNIFAVDPELADPILLWLVNKIYISRPMKKFAMPVLSNTYGNNIV